MTDQRERMSTDPGIGPVEVDNTTTLRSIANVVEVEVDGASLYYEPQPLVAVSDHRTLEMQTVKLSEDIDPRKLPTQVNLLRSPLPPRFDSGWPQAEVVLTSSQRPASPPRRWRVPAVLLGVLGALLSLVFARSATRRDVHVGAAGAALSVASVTPVVPAAMGASTSTLGLASGAPSGPPTAPGAVIAPAPATNADGLTPAGSIVDSRALAPVARASSAPTRSAPRPPVHATRLLRNAASKPTPQPASNNPTLAVPSAKPKRTIY